MKPTFCSYSLGVGIIINLCLAYIHALKLLDLLQVSLGLQEIDTKETRIGLHVTE